MNVYTQGTTKPLPSTSDNLLCPVILQIILLCHFLNNEVMFYSIMCVGHWKGGRNRERKMSLPTYKPRPVLCTKAKVAKGGRICGTLWYMWITSLEPLNSAPNCYAVTYHMVFGGISLVPRPHPRRESLVIFGWFLGLHYKFIAYCMHICKLITNLRCKKVLCYRAEVASVALQIMFSAMWLADERFSPESNQC